MRQYESRGEGDDRPRPSFDRRRVNSAASQAAIEFDAFRRGLIEDATPVSGAARSQWLARVMELSDLVCPSEEVRIRKPGLATRLFSAEIALPGHSDEELPSLVARLDEVWQGLVPEGIAWKSCSYPDRRDMFWEVAVEASEGYVTASVKLRTASFYVEAKGPRRDSDERGEGSGEDRGRRPFRGEGRPSRFSRDRGEGGPEAEEGSEERPSRDDYRDDRGHRPSHGGGRPSYGGERRPFGDRKKFGSDRPPYGDRPHYGGDRPHYGGDRPSYGGDRRERRFDGDRDRDRPSYDDRKRSFGGDRPPYGGGDRPKFGGRPSYGDRDRGDRPSYGDDRRERRFDGDRDRDRPSYDDRKRSFGGDRPPYGGGDRPKFGGRPSYGDRDRGGRPPFRDDRGRDDRGGDRPPFRDNRDDRGGRPPFRDDRGEDRGSGFKPGGFSKPGGFKDRPQGAKFKKSGAPDWVKRKKQS